MNYLENYYTNYDLDILEKTVRNHRYQRRTGEYICWSCEK